MKSYMIAKSSVVEIQNLVVNHESPTVKTNSVLSNNEYHVSNKCHVLVCKLKFLISVHQ